MGRLTIRVAVAAESAIERAGLVATLAGSPGVSVVHTTEQVRDVEAMIAGHDVDVAVIALARLQDLPLPLDLAADFVHRAPALVLLTNDATSSDGAPARLFEALANGVAAALPRDANADELLAAVQAAGSGLVALTRESFAGMTAGRITRTVVSSVETLTRREAEILGMLADGLANKEIAARLQISAHTVKTHVQSLFTKLGADSRAEAVALGVRRGLIHL